MQATLNYWILQTLAMCLTIALLPRLKTTSILGPIGIVVALAFVNTRAWDTALFFHIPDRLTFHVLLLFLTNGVIFWVLVKLLPGIEIDGFLPALLAPIVFTICSLLIARYGKDIDWKPILDGVLDILSRLKEYFFSHVETGSVPTTNLSE